MSFVPNSISRFGHRSLLKLNGASPTLLVVGGVVGLGVTAVMAARATRNIDPIIEDHHKQRVHIDGIAFSSKKARQKELLHLYTRTAVRFTRLYGPTVAVGITSSAAVLSGHKILHTRQVATLAAYSGLVDQFDAYRRRVAKTWGEDVEKGIYEGAHGEWKDSEEHPGEKSLQPVFDHSDTDHYLRPWFDETNVNWTRDPMANYAFLKGVQTHMNNMLQHRGHVFLNDVFDGLGMQRREEGAVMGWLYEPKEGEGDGYVDFGFMHSIDPNTVAFCNGVERVVRLNFNIDEKPIWNRINDRKQRR